METTYSWTDECYTGLEKADPQYERFSYIIRELNESSDKAIARRLRTEMVLDWRDEYNVGVWAIDSQHKRFFKVIRKISDLHLTGGSHKDEKVQLNRLLDKLLKYTEFHFQTEEKLMKRYEYPMINQQKKEHEVILSELNRQISTIRSAGGSTAKLVYFLVQWFIKHTVYSDKDLGLFIKRKRNAQAFRFNLNGLKGAAQKVTGVLNQPLTSVDVMNFLNRPVTTVDVMDFLNQPLDIWGNKEGSVYPVS